MPHLWCGGGVCGFFVRALRVDMSVEVLLLRCQLDVCSASLMRSLHSYLWLPPPSQSDGVHSRRALLVGLELLDCWVATLKALMKKPHTPPPHQR